MSAICKDPLQRRLSGPTFFKLRSPYRLSFAAAWQRWVAIEANAAALALLKPARADDFRRN